MLRKRRNQSSTVKLDANMTRLKVKNAYVGGREELKYIISKRQLQSDKRSNGTVLVIGGSKDYHGAPVLAGTAAYNALASLRTGAGYVKAAVPSSILVPVRSLSADIIAFTSGKNSIVFNKRIGQEIEKANVVALGMGLGRSVSAAKTAMKVIDECNSLYKRTVIDADGIHAMSVQGKKSKLGDNFVITPNDKEFYMLTGHVPNKNRLEERICDAEKLAAKLQSVVLLKGHTTIVTDGNRTTVNRAKSSALAVMGTGDVLSGIIAGCAANSRDVYGAAVAGAHIHSEIGDILYKRMGAHIIASDIVGEIPRFFERFGR